MTAFVEIALAALVPSLTKLLVNAYLGAGAADVAGSLTASASGPLGETLKRRQLARRIEGLADRVAVELMAALESDGVRPEAFSSIAKEIEIALNGRVQVFAKRSAGCCFIGASALLFSAAWRSFPSATRD